MLRTSLFAAIIVANAIVAAAQGPTPGPSDSAPRLSANRVILRVANLAESITFYRDAVGLPLQSTFDELAVLGDRGLTLMLQQVPRKSSGPSTGLSALTEMVFESADIFRSYESMKARGVTFRFEPQLATVDGERDVYTADFRDPDGHILSIAGWVPRSSNRSRQ